MADLDTGVPPLKNTTLRVTAKKTPPYEPIQVSRKVRHYSVSSTELIGLSIASPIGSALFGFGVSLSCEWAGSPDGRQRLVIGWAALGALAFGGAILIGVGAFFFIVKRQSPLN